MKKTILVALGLLLSLSVSQARGLANMIHFNGELKYGELQSVIYTLGLTLEQQEKLQTIARDKMLSSVTEHQALIQGEMPQTAMEQKLEKLKTAFANKTFNKDLFVQTKVDEANEMAALIADKTQDNATRDANAIEDLLSILTDAQKTLFFANVQALQAPKLTAGLPEFLGAKSTVIDAQDFTEGTLPEALQDIEVKSTYTPSVR